MVESENACSQNVVHELALSMTWDRRSIHNTLYYVLGPQMQNVNIGEPCKNSVCLYKLC